MRSCLPRTGVRDSHYPTGQPMTEAKRNRSRVQANQLRLNPAPKKRVGSWCTPGASHWTSKHNIPDSPLTVHRTHRPTLQYMPLESFSVIDEAKRLTHDPIRLTVESFRLIVDPKRLMHEAHDTQGRGSRYSRLRHFHSPLSLFASTMTRKDSRIRLPILKRDAPHPHG